ncbi:MAG: hypothetical protein COX39_01860 [Candidatus Nealsonbacteria bacterium CG23_combo_of_CG06-09_8_20_14_all_40_13]|uniref:Uncharacterized protein n=1 Tax=Candidatus Nealsonbacteria bacterium CG23_combo_of_CG06-09_8_20_14_all_40_13 TaxID=1974724 RepID=A0A2G9YT13_9BACT|nr:MAG: hypothetical protein COX39_01860 [Candidatus Nealsonbacteria bacterium CG23_combo_of_CG06-09_8_20_14_all_40_13]PIR70861.1 MAG: hypothetical protein COU44_02695 [Candidatus Nealsonbacteria bacterium CG10_big_fil_rev_8_21_14_0_10_40_24]PIU43045.1 MAG: hypothetical protein COS97_03165 [Candidatus Nealsonbacteria bacterium CG07_land_8_20_14_0_80_40_10]
MTLRHYLFLLFSSTLVSAGIWLVIFFNIDPTSADIMSISAFFASLFWFLAGFLTFIGFYLRNWFGNREIIYANLSPSLRQAILISIAATGLLVFSYLKVLSLWTAIPFVIICLLIELYFQSR